MEVLLPQLEKTILGQQLKYNDYDYTNIITEEEKKQCDVYSYVHSCSVHPGSQAVDFSESVSSIFESTTDTTLKFCVSRNIIMMKPQYQEQKKSHHWLQGPIHFIMFFLCNLKLFFTSSANDTTSFSYYCSLIRSCLFE